MSEVEEGSPSGTLGGPAKSEYLVWLDLETTGLEPLGGRILEAAYAITTIDDLETPLKRFSSVISAGDWENLASREAVAMHNASGLAGALKRPRSHVPLIDFESIICQNIDKVYDEASLYTTPLFHLAGSSIHFDRRWIRHYMPALETRLHYRMLDVSALRLMFGDQGLSTRESTHRAASDVDRSIAMLSHYRQVMLRRAGRIANANR
jgi:oligoribonuclease